MANLAPRTIVITRLAPKTTEGNSMIQLSNMKREIMDDSYDSYETFDDGTPRKRRRLTNLSPEERMMRRKLKNRVAAQTARDRKKARMDQLEDSLAELAAENKRLQSQNQSLVAQKKNLAQENERLRERLGVVAPRGSVSLVKREAGSTLESAALSGVVPLQQELLTRLAQHSVVNYTAWILTASLMCCLASSSKSKQPVTSSLKTTLQSPSMLSRTPSKNQPLTLWWGPHQQSWNPSINL